MRWRIGRGVAYLKVQATQFDGVVGRGRCDGLLAGGHQRFGDGGVVGRLGRPAAALDADEETGDERREEDGTDDGHDDPDDAGFLRIGRRNEGRVDGHVGVGPLRQLAGRHLAHVQRQIVGEGRRRVEVLVRRVDDGTQEDAIAHRLVELLVDHGLVDASVAQHEGVGHVAAQELGGHVRLQVLVGRFDDTRLGVGGRDLRHQVARHQLVGHQLRVQRALVLGYDDQQVVADGTKLFRSLR